MIYPLIIVKTYPVNDPSIRVLACRLINSLNDEIILILENAVTTIRLRDAIHPSLEMLQNTHENAVTTLVAYNPHENAVTTMRTLDIAGNATEHARERGSGENC